MTFTELKTEIKDRLNYTSTDSDTRVGRLINKVYRQIGTSIGLSFSRQASTSKVVTIGNPEVTFTGTEKVLQVWTLDVDAHPTILDEVMYSALREVIALASDSPKKWALHTTASNTVTIRLDAAPETAYTIYAEIIAEVADLSGANEPAFAESFHDILIEGVLKDEYRKLEKIQLARESEAAYERRLSDLRMFIAKSNLLKIRQGELSESAARTVGSGQASLGSTALNITALWTFNRGSAVAPFAITATDALYVTNLGAEFIGNVTTDRLIGRDTAATGESEQLTVGGGIEFTGSGGIQTSAFTGDVTKAAGGVATTIANDAVTYAKMQNIATDSLVGRDTAATGDPETILLNTTLSMDGSGNLQRAALTGDVTASAGSNTTTIANDAVTYAKMQDTAAASVLLGRGSAAGAGNVQEITAAGSLAISGTTITNIPRVNGTTSSATPTPDADTTDLYNLTALAEAATFGAPTGTPVNGQKLIIRIKDNGTARALAWNASYVAGGTTLPTTTVLSKILHVGFMYNTDNSLNKWMCLASQQEV